MIREVVFHIFIFLLFWLLQGLVFNNVLIFNGLFFPLPYIFALLILPFRTPKWALMFIGLAYGLLIDSFTNTLGMHASACVFMTFLMPYVARIFSTKENFGVLDKPTIYSRGFTWYLSYTLVLTILHHAWLFGIEWFKMDNFTWILLRIILSAIITTGLIILFQYIFIAQSKRSHK